MISRLEQSADMEFTGGGAICNDNGTNCTAASGVPLVRVGKVEQPVLVAFRQVDGLMGRQVQVGMLSSGGTA